MFFFAHLGGGAQMVLPLRPRLPLRWLLLGCVLPDLIDKPLYYAVSWIYGPHSRALDFLGCTRNLAHTGLFLAALLILASARRSERLLAVGLGVATHDFLDLVEDLCRGLHQPWSEALAFFYPLSGHFGQYPDISLGRHLLTGVEPFRLSTEVIGLFLLLMIIVRRRAKRPRP